MDDIKITKKERGNDGHRVLSIRVKEDVIIALDRISIESNRSRNEIIGIILEDAVTRIKIVE